MDRKKILSFQRDNETIESLKKMVADSNWEVNVKSELDEFLLELDPLKYHLLIVEEESLNDDVRELLDAYNLPVIFISDLPGKLKNKIVLPENFSAIDLKKAMTKASFLKISEPDEKEDGCCIEPDDSSEGEEAVLLEPVLGETEDDEAVVLTSENESDRARSSWEIPEKEVLDICDAESLSQEVEQKQEKIIKEAARESSEDKSAIFDKMDEIDNLIKGLSDDIANEKSFGTHVSENDIQSTPPLTSDLFDSDDNGEENIFDDDYSFPKEEDPGDKTIQAESEKIESQSKIASDFEAIMSENKKDDYEEEWLESEKESEPVVHEEEPVEAEPVEEVLSKAEVLTESVEDYKNEIHAWLEKNGRKIIKEVVEEQLSKIWEKK